MFRLPARILSVVVIVCNFACSERNYAPVIDASTIEDIPKTGVHKVTRGETLYSIAWRYGLDYRYVAKRNQLKSPYLIHIGQSLDLSGDHEFIHLTNVSLNTHMPKSTVHWLIPAKGKIIANFSSANKGINISGHIGDPIYAAHSGEVVYCGDGLRGYGNLIILKHSGEYLSAYAHNRVTFVKEGDLVTQGQKIAEMGNKGADKIMLHFEIRRNGKPIDPLSLFR